MSTGIVRKVDQLGRIVLPKEMRRSFEIEINDSMEIFVDGDKIVLQKYAPRKACMLTGKISDDNVVLGNGKLTLSKEAIEEILPALEKYTS
jgi:transcriptional pleiotropic regulator of transition state genes